MVRLTFVEKDPSKRQADIDKFYEDLYSHIRGDKKKMLNDYCNKHKNAIVKPLKTQWPSEIAEIDKRPFFYIMRASYNTLTIIKGNLDRSPSKYKTTKKLTKYLANTLFSSIDHKQFISFFDTRVCPYCNRNYIGYKKANVIYQLDHFYEKANYPILAASFYNLVPSCSSCNGRKSTASFSYSPYSDIDVDKELRITYKPKSASYMNNPDAIDVQIEASSVMAGNVNVLDLENVYKVHSDTVQELLWKRHVYSDEYIESICKLLGLSKPEVDRLITGAYCEKENYGKRPLSKLMADISKEIGLR